MIVERFDWCLLGAVGFQPTSCGQDARNSQDASIKTTRLIQPNTGFSQARFTELGVGASATTFLTAISLFPDAAADKPSRISFETACLWRMICSARTPIPTPGSFAALPPKEQGEGRALIQFRRRQKLRSFPNLGRLFEGIG